MDRILSRIMNEVAEENNIPREEVEAIYNNMFRFVRSKLEAIDFSDVENEVDLRKKKVNFNIPRLFKLYTNIGRVNYARKSIAEKNSKYVERTMFGDDAKRG